MERLWNNKLMEKRTRTVHQAKNNKKLIENPFQPLYVVIIYAKTHFALL